MTELTEMKSNFAALAVALEAIVGGEHVTPHPAISVDSIKPALLVEPGGAGEVVACLKACGGTDVAVVPAGAMTWLNCGNPLRRADVILSLRRMSRVVEYSPPDLTVTVEAGMSLLALNEHLSRQRLWLPLDPPGDAASTLGAIAACASQGGLRLGYGTPRDYVIGLRLAHIDGTESRSGGRVVKNVAGYDLNKLYVGSYGTLAVITELTFKLRPLPEKMATVMVTDRDFSTMSEKAKQIFNSADLQLASLLLTHQTASGATAYELFIRFADSEKAVNRQIEEVKNLVGSAEVVENDQAVWGTRIEKTFTDDGNVISVRLSVPTSIAAEVFEVTLSSSDGIRAEAYLGVGIIRAAFRADEAQAVAGINALRQVAHAAAGNLFIEQAPASVREACGVWEDAGGLSQLMRGIKRNFDPQSQLNPGKFVAGI